MTTKAEKEAKQAAARFREEQRERERLEQEHRQEIARRAAEGLTANARGPAQKPPELAITQEMVVARDAGREAWAPPQPPIDLTPEERKAAIESRNASDAARR